MADAVATQTIRGVGGGRADQAYDKEIDASLDMLDALDNGPTGTSLPDDRTGENDQVPSTEDAGGGDLVTSVVHPHTIRDAAPVPTDRPRMGTDPSITTTSDSAVPAPLTARGGADADDPTGSNEVGTNDLLESTHSGPQDEEEIVIADDLAEIVDDGSNENLEESTDAGSGTVPPNRSEGRQPIGSRAQPGKTSATPSRAASAPSTHARFGAP
jgi:hypothetical protein